jgi:GR25 family glycosyltransferase involved in LPS biosynthesis
MFNKLEGFGPLYIINLERRSDRLSIVMNNLKSYNITDFNIIKAIDASCENLNNFYINGGEINNNEMGATLSHLKAIKHWLDTNDTDYAIFMEDDFSFETVDFWSFSWKEFINNINFDYEVLQLSITNGSMNFNIHKRDVSDFSAGVYLIKREHAKKFVESIWQEGKWKLPGNALADHYIYNVANTYSVPLFTFNMETKSDVNPAHRPIHENSRNLVLDFWQKGGLTLNS